MVRDHLPSQLVTAVLSQQGLLQQSETHDTAPRKKRLAASSSPTAMKQLYYTAPKKKTNNEYVRLVQPSAQSGSLSTGVPGVHTHCIAEEILQSAPLNVLSKEIQLLVLVQHTNELQHIGVVQAAHHLHLQAETSHPKKWMLQPSPAQGSQRKLKPQL